MKLSSIKRRNQRYVKFKKNQEKWENLKEKKNWYIFSKISLYGYRCIRFILYFFYLKKKKLDQGQNLIFFTCISSLKKLN